MNITVMNSEYVSSSLMKLFLSLFPPGWIKKERKDWEEEKKSWNLLGHHQEPVIFFSRFTTRGFWYSWFCHPSARLLRLWCKGPSIKDVDNFEGGGGVKIALKISGQLELKKDRNRKGKVSTYRKKLPTSFMDGSQARASPKSKHTAEYINTRARTVKHEEGGVLLLSP